jgi:hypothetical protein
MCEATHRKTRAAPIPRAFLAGGLTVPQGLRGREKSARGAAQFTGNT